MLNISFVIGILFIFTLCLVGYFIFKKTTLTVEEETDTFVLSLGQVKEHLQTSGLHFVPEKLLPWVQTVSVSKQIDYRTYKNIHVNDHYGTTVIVDLWIEFRVSDPYKALFGVENWEEVLESSVKHTTASILCAQTVPEILKHRTELADQLRYELELETERWGITISGAMIQNIGLLPEISKQFFNTVAARIERTKALIEEEGRLRVAKLEADTQFKIAELSGLAKSQLPIAISNTYRSLSEDPKVLKAFQDYWELINLDPRKTVSFNGFAPSAIDALEASMAVESVLNH